MNDEEKMLHIFELLEGKMTGSFSAEIVKDEEGFDKPIAVACVKDGEVKWQTSREDLMFAYVTRDLD